MDPVLIPVFCCRIQMAQSPSSLQSATPPSSSRRSLVCLEGEGKPAFMAAALFPLLMCPWKSLEEPATCLADNTHILCLWSLGFYSWDMMGLFAARLPSFPEESFPDGSVSNTVWSCHSLTQTSGCLPHRWRLMQELFWYLC